MGVVISNYPFVFAEYYCAKLCNSIALCTFFTLNFDSGCWLKYNVFSSGTSGSNGYAPSYTTSSCIVFSKAVTGAWAYNSKLGGTILVFEPKVFILS